MILNLAYPEKSEIKFKVSKFPDGQQQVTILQDFFKSNLQVGSDITIKSRLNNFLDLELIICATKSIRGLFYGKIGVRLEVPYFLGSRSDRKFEDGSCNYLKDVICPIINSLEFESVTCIDPHSDILEACLNNFIKESNSMLFNWLDIENKKGNSSFHPFNGILISPDAGSARKIYKLADKHGFKGDIITCSKERDKEGKLTKCVVPLSKDKSYSGKDFIIIDDICDGGKTFINISEEIRKQVGGKHYLIVTHGIFSKGFGELIQYFDRIYCTNSYKDFAPDTQPFIKQLNIF